ncbi:MAG: hypothetical protein AB7D03_06760 [Thiomicrospira sp.]
MNESWGQAKYGRLQDVIRPYLKCVKVEGKPGGTGAILNHQKEVNEDGGASEKTPYRVTSGLGRLLSNADQSVDWLRPPHCGVVFFIHYL